MSREKEEALRARMASLGMREEDIVETFILSGKKGGQKVNKTSACVRLKHRPTGLEVKCQATRSQGLNRFLARRILADKIDAFVMGRESEGRKRAEKIRRQKRRRSRRSKEKMLESKKRRSEKKELRRSPSADQS